MTSDIDVEKGGFTFIWAIENFSYSLEKVNWIQSPWFLSFPHDRVSWCLQVNSPETDDKILPLTVCLFSERWVGIGNRIFPVTLKISILADDGSPAETIIAKEKLVFKKKHFGVDFLVNREVMFGLRNEMYLPRDTLTLSCRLWPMDEDFSGDGSVSYARTRIGVERRTFHWAIKRFSVLQPLQRTTIMLHPLSKQAPNMRLDLFSDEDQIELEVTHADQQRRVKIVCKISVLDSSGKVLESGEGEHVFKSSARNLVWQFPPFLTKTKLAENRASHLPNDVLNLRCECTLSGFVVSNVIEMDAFTDNAPSIPCPASTSVRPLDLPVVRDLKRMFEDGVLSDLTIRTKQRDFHVHKAVLAARSPVFRTIFGIDTHDGIQRSNTSAARSSIFKSSDLDVPDVDADAMLGLLKYIYSDEVEEADRSLEGTEKLYRAAGKYGIVPLGDMCAAVLKSRLSVTNACEILALANAHEDGYLKSSVRDFMFAHGREIIGTDQWKTFEKDHNLLSVETLRELYIQKMNS